MEIEPNRLWELAINNVLLWEGLYSNTSGDPGGETKFGISKRSHQNLNIRDLTEERAKEIYLEEYWKPLSLDYVRSPISLQVLEYAVLAGPATAAKMLQRALVELGFSQTIQVDGKVGPKTLAAVREANQLQLSEELFDQMRSHLEGIILSKPKLRKFRTGWFRRIRATKEQVSLCLG